MNVIRILGIVQIILLGCAASVSAQKLVIDGAAINNWPKINTFELNQDGSYASFVTPQQDADKDRSPILTVASTTDGRNFQISGIAQWDFCPNGRGIFVRTINDSLFFIDLASQRKIYSFDNVHDYKLPGDIGAKSQVAIHKKDNHLIVLNIESGKKWIFEDVENFGFSDDGRWLFLDQVHAANYNAPVTLSLWNTLNQSEKEIWHGKSLGAVVFNDKRSSRIAFIVKDSIKNLISNALWYFETGLKRPIMLFHDTTTEVGDSLKMDASFVQVLDGAGAIAIHVRKVYKIVNAMKGYTGVSVWNYQDIFQKNDSGTPKERTFWLALVYVKTRRVSIISRDSDVQFDPFINRNPQFSFALTYTLTNGNEAYRKGVRRPDIYLIDLSNGNRKCIARNTNALYLNFSANGRYVIWYDRIAENYFTYNLATGKVIDVTCSIHNKIVQRYLETMAITPYGIGGWMAGDSSILIYDRYDIWKVDPDGLQKPINSTNGFGKKNKTILRLLDAKGPNWIGQTLTDASKSVFLCAFNERTKENGFYKMRLSMGGNPKKLVMMPKYSYFSQSIDGNAFPFFMRTSGDGKVYCLKMGSESTYPNLCYTRDFEHFRTLTHYAPEKNYNWLTAQLLHWKTFSGKQGTGILYKPEDFDSTKRYPVILFFYERMSTRLHVYQTPEWATGPINIPWFVSRGYLVFCPDIHYTLGNPGAGIFDYVVSAAKMLAKYRWVDPEKMGIAGHSWGGYEVNYLVGKTNIFKAALAASGISDLIPFYAGKGLSVTSGPSEIERGQVRMGEPIWDIPGAYVKNSPIFSVNRINTPLLLMNNDSDINVPWTQGLEMFSLMRYLNKPVWMLQYRNGDHTVDRTEDAEDYTLKITSFFDHFLKSAPDPLWMKPSR